MDGVVSIFSLTNDIHAFAVADELERRHRLRCHIVLVDRLSGKEGLSWSNTKDIHATYPAADGARVSLNDVDLIWWRRFPREELIQIPPTVTNEAAREVIASDSRSALLGLLLTRFSGVWVSHPEATRRAENKLVQLEAAQHAGLRVPRTLVSQDSDTIRRFVADAGSVIVKPLVGTIQTPLQTGLVSPELLARDAPLTLCPAIYQEYVPGTRHLRVCCFGGTCHSAVITSPNLDWRVGPMEGEQYTIPQSLSQRLSDVLDLLELRMGIFDLKLTDDDEPVWLEVNPQGQFLFLEGLCGLPLLAAFAQFLAGIIRETLASLDA